MDTLKIGILSDTHLSAPDADFMARVNACFSDCSMIIHAGDLTSASVLKAFPGKEVHAVHGNMCEASSYHALPESQTIQVGKFTIAVTHGHIAGFQRDIEEFLLTEFDMPDCLIYGHTHRPVCHQVGPTLVINPGSFRGSGTYAILKVSETLSGSIQQVPRLA